jgi:hypothetical protein
MLGCIPPDKILSNLSGECFRVLVQSRERRRRCSVKNILRSVLNQPLKRRHVDVRADLDTLHAERVGMVWACFDLPGFDEHLSELVRVVVILKVVNKQ